MSESSAEQQLLNDLAEDFAERQRRKRGADALLDPNRALTITNELPENPKRLPSPSLY